MLFGPQLRLLGGDSGTVQFDQPRLPFVYQFRRLTRAPLGTGKHSLHMDALLCRLVGGMIGHIDPDAHEERRTTGFYTSWIEYAMSPYATTCPPFSVRRITMSGSTAGRWKGRPFTYSFPSLKPRCRSLKQQSSNRFATASLQLCESRPPSAEAQVERVPQNVPLVFATSALLLRHHRRPLRPAK